MSNKPTIDTSWELKWRRTLRKKLLNCLVLIENHGKPTQDLMYELKQKEKGNPYTLQELKASHHNFMLDQMLESLKLWAKTKSLNKKT